MAAPAGHPAFPRDAWPSIELKRLPNGQMGVLMEFPAPPELRASFDVLSFLIEPQRALVLRRNLDDVLEVMGIADKNFAKAIETAVVDAAGGTVEGQPTSRINYLQRIRWLAKLDAAVQKFRDEDHVLIDSLLQEVGPRP